MKLKLFTVLLLSGTLFFPLYLNAQTGAAPKVVLLQPDDLSDPAKYNNSDVVRSIIHNSVNTFMGVIPGVALSNLTFSTNPSPGDFPRWNADYVLYGSFRLQGPKMNPTALIEWKVWSKSVGRDIFSTNYKTLTDIEIFDAIDDMVTNSARMLLKRNVGIAQIAFNNFRIGREPHAVILNDKTMTVASNDSFSLSLKVPSDSKFKFIIRRKSDNKTVSSGTLLLAPGESTNISYRAPAGPRLFYEQKSLYLQTGAYVSGTNRYELGLFGASGELLNKITPVPSNGGHLSFYSVDRVLGWSFLGTGAAGTVMILCLMNSNWTVNMTDSQKGWTGLGSIVLTATSYILSGLFFNLADNELEKAVWNYNRFLLFENGSSMVPGDIRIGLFCLGREF